MCFFLTQVIARPILLNAVGYFYPPLQLALFASIWSIVIGAVTAGIFEEGGRYLVWRKWRKGIPPTFQDAVAFGIGHAGCEAVLGIGIGHLMTSWNVLYPMELTLRSLLTPLNRVFAGLGHVAFTLLVFYGLRKGKGQKLFLLLAVFYHFALDFIGGLIINRYEYAHSFWGFSWPMEHPDAFMLLYIALTVATSATIIYLMYRSFVRLDKAEASHPQEVLEAS